MPLHGADESRKSNRCVKNNNRKLLQSVAMGKTQQTCANSIPPGSTVPWLGASRLSVGHSGGAKATRIGERGGYVSYTERLGACNHVRKNRHRAPDSTRAGALGLWRVRLCVGGARRKRKRAVAMECVEMLGSNGGERGREGERRRGREQGLQEPGDAGLGQEGKPLPFRSLRVPYVFPDFTFLRFHFLPRRP